MNPFFPSTAITMFTKHDHINLIRKRNNIVQQIIKKISSWNEDNDEPDLSYTVRYTGLAQEIIIGQNEAMVWIGINKENTSPSIEIYCRSEVTGYHPNDKPSNTDASIKCSSVKEATHELKEILEIESKTEDTDTQKTR